VTPKVRVESQLSLTLCNPPNISAQRPLLALSGHFEQARRMSAIGGKAGNANVPSCHLMTR
jgi:hypothetical protein